MFRLRLPSLFWTFALSFLAVLIVAAALQVGLVAAVLGPLNQRWTEDRAALSLRAIANEVAALPAPVADEQLTRVLRAHRQDAPGVGFAFTGADGRVVGERRRRSGPGGEIGPPEGPGAPPESLRDRPGERRPGGTRPSPIARLAIDTPNGVRGELVAFAPGQRFPFLPHLPRGTFALSFPLAILVAGAAGLLLFRASVKRLGALETLASRVAAGDYDVRVSDAGVDEIGRLADRLNRMTEQLAAQRASVKDNDRQRRQLLADISHELGTPLTSVRGYAETLLNPAVDVSQEERVTYLKDILEEANRLDLLIQELFELTRLEAGAVPLVRERLDWDALCRNMAARLEPRFRDAGIALAWAGPPREAPVWADGRRLEQVIANLLVNALRYVPAGSTVTLALDQVGQGDRFRLTVTDDGPGVPAEALPHLFDRFYRADPARAEAGTGLGLAIVQEIVRQHDGAVRAENHEPHGARFIVELPAANPGVAP